MVESKVLAVSTDATVVCVPDTDSNTGHQVRLVSGGAPHYAGSSWYAPLCLSSAGRQKKKQPSASFRYSSLSLLRIPRWDRNVSSRLPGHSMELGEVRYGARYRMFGGGTGWVSERM